jgi:hypothetical protein
LEGWIENKNNFNKRKNKSKDWELNWKKQNNIKFDWRIKLKKKTLTKGPRKKNWNQKNKEQNGKNNIWQIVIEWLNWKQTKFL